jgi:hypothetical protein
MIFNLILRDKTEDLKTALHYVWRLPNQKVIYFTDATRQGHTALLSLRCTSTVSFTADVSTHLQLMFPLIYSRCFHSFTADVSTHLQLMFPLIYSPCFHSFTADVSTHLQLMFPLIYSWRFHSFTNFHLILPPLSLLNPNLTHLAITS